MIVFEALAWGRSELSSKKGIRGGLESELLLSHILGVSREWIHTWGQREIPLDLFQKYQEAIYRRQKDEPLEYITNQASFYSQNFFVDNRVLIPRPETEILVDRVSLLIEKFHIKKVAEIGVGSGVISIILGLKFPHLKIIATDISQDSLEVARKNILSFKDEASHIVQQIDLRHTNLLDGIKEDFELLVSNPPYIATDYPLENNVLKEPHCALFGGKNGDEILLKIIQEASKRKINFLCCEMGYDQKKSLEGVLSASGFKADFYQDLSGFDRGFVAQNLMF